MLCMNMWLQKKLKAVIAKEQRRMNRERMWGEKGEKGPTERLEGRESKN